jgi:hypothetical protein
MASLIRHGLVQEGLSADVADRGEDALWMSESHEYDVNRRLRDVHETSAALHLGVCSVADRARFGRGALRYGRGEVRLAVHRADGRTEVHVKDEGTGFDPTFVEHAFERFSRGDRGRVGPRRGGSGSRSSRRSPAPTAAAHTWPAEPPAARTSGPSCPPPLSREWTPSGASPLTRAVCSRGMLAPPQPAPPCRQRRTR